MTAEGQPPGTSERDRVDKALDAAREEIHSLRDDDEPVAALMVQLYLTEALVRSIRDLDDDVYWLWKKALPEGLGDIAVVLDGRSEE